MPKRKTDGPETEPDDRSGKCFQSNPLRKSIKMDFLNIFKSFANDEAGAVTVDWVVLTAAIVGLGIVVMKTVGGGVETLSTNVSTKVAAQAVGYTATP